MQQIAIFGATGRTGRVACRAGIDRGYGVTAVVRPHAGDGGLPAECRIVGCDLERPEDLAAVLAGGAAVFCLFGPRPQAPEPFCAGLTGTIVAAMRAAGVPRLLCLTGAMIGSYPTRRSWLVRRMVAAFAGRYPDSARDRVEQEAVVAGSGLDWLIVKPPRLTDGPATGRILAGEDLRIDGFSRLSRRDLVDFMVDQLDADRFGGRRVMVKEGDWWSRLWDQPEETVSERAARVNSP